MRDLVRGTIALMALAMMASGCSSADGDTVDPSTSSTASAIGTPIGEDTSRETPTTVPADGEPIRIGISGPFESQSLNLPEVRDAAQAAVDAANERGGLSGRPIELVACNDEMSPDGAAACGREFAEDASIVSVVGSTSVLGDAFLPMLEEAGLPDVGAYPTTPRHLTSEVVYPLQGGIFSAYAGDARMALDEGFEDIAIVYNDLPTAALVLAGIDSVFADAGIEPVAELPVAVTVPDVAPSVQEALRAEPDAVIVAFAQPMLSRMLQGFEQAGADVPLLIGSGDLNQDELLALGPAADGVLGTSPLPPSTTDDPVPAIRRFNDELDTFASGEVKRNAVALNAWAAVQLFIEAAQSADEISRDGIRAAIETFSAYETDGLTPPIDFTTTPTVQPRLFNGSVAPLRLAAGLYEYDGDFLDPYAP